MECVLHVAVRGRTRSGDHDSTIYYDRADSDPPPLAAFSNSNPEFLLAL